MENEVVKELNTVLEGHYMAIHGYEKFIENIHDTNIKSELQKIQRDHKTHAGQIAERIQNLGARPVDGAGIKGVMSEIKDKLKGTNEDTQFILKDALTSEDKGIKMTEEVVRGDLDNESKRIIQEILDKDREHVNELNTLLYSQQV